MKLAIDASRANSVQRTGVESYAYHVIQELKRIIPAEVEVVLYTRESLVQDLSDLPNNWTSKVLAWPPKRLWTQLRLSFEMLLNKPDVLFVPAHVLPIVHPKKSIMTVHDVAALRFPKAYNWFERWYSVWSATYAARHATQIITISEFTKKELQSLVSNISAEISVIPIACDDAYKSIADEQLLESVQKKYAITKPFLLSISRLEFKKNTDRIVHACNEIKKNHDVQLVLVGKPGHGYKKIEHAIENSPYKKDIIVPGWVDEEDLVALMNAARVFVFPSLYEGFGIPALEAMQCGTPVVASKDTSLEEVCGDAAIYADRKDAQDIANQMQRLLEDKTLRDRMSIAGEERAQQFSWKLTAQATWDSLKSL